jgi:3'-phosphoadenosine 5'-phosphosulfate sulfotransferase (PAPS reductase)/FAD synthetase
MTPMEMMERGAIVYASHSGGKDSQAMMTVLRRVVPKDQLVVVHADLGRVEWEGTKQHIEDTCGLPVNVVRSHKDFFDMVRARHQKRPDVPPWPSPRYRQCTADLKRSPIYRFIRADMKSRGAKLAINAMGLRAEESTARSRRPVVCENRELSRAGRCVMDWLPIFRMTTDQVFSAIREAGEEPHPAYALGNERLSCVFCIMGCRGDLLNGAKARPSLLAEIERVERETGWTFFAAGSLRSRIEGGAWA